MNDLLNCEENNLSTEDLGQVTRIENSNSNNPNLGTVWYFGDPMCSWCWGISEELSKLIDNYRGRLDFQMVMGGLRPGGGEEWNAQFKDFLRQHWEHVATVSGQEFNHKLFEKESFNYDTEPPSRAVVIIKVMYPELAFEFMKRVSKRFYVGNEDPNEDEFYKPICDEMKLDFASFKVLFHSEKFRKETIKEFQKSRDYGASGFPTIMFEHRKRFTIITRGYNSAERMIERIDVAIAKAEKIEEEKRKLNS